MKDPGAEPAHRVPCNTCAFTARASDGSGRARPGTKESPEAPELAILANLSVAASLRNKTALNDPGRAASFF